MPDTFQRAASAAHAPLSARPGREPLAALWREGLSIVNLRGDPRDPEFRASVRKALDVDLPETAGGISEGLRQRIVEAGPDDWFVIGAPGEAAASMVALRKALAGLHTAVTDVSSGYTVLRLSGPPVRDVLAQGCPLDLHPRAFGPGRCAGSHFFKASVWLWRAPDAFELLVRRSFAGYMRLMLERTTRECGLVVESS
ncbi:MAG: hypothetical protein RIS35_240 [Pseudomonadota bacterium]|jgi:sarcosine oxidase subunit gamma